MPYTRAMARAAKAHAEAAAAARTQVAYDAGKRFILGVGSYVGKRLYGAGRKQLSSLSRKRKATTKKRAIMNKKSKKDPLTRKIERVLNGNHSVGTYTKQWNGTLPNVLNEQQRMDIAAEQDGVTVARDFRFFSSRKILDAVSVMFNNKVHALDFNISTNNFEITGLKVVIPYMSVRVTFFNNSSVGHFYEISICKSKKNQPNDILSKINSELNSIVQVGGVEKTTVYPGVKVGQMPIVKSDYSVTTKKFQLQPAQSKTIRLTVKNYTLEYDKVVEKNVLNEFIKGLTVEMIVRHWPHFTTADKAGKTVAGMFTTSDSQRGCVVSCKEIYKIQAPEQTADDRNKDNVGWYYEAMALTSEVPYTNTKPFEFNQARQ